MKRRLLIISSVIVTLIGAAVVFWPSNWVVRGPVLEFMLGWQVDAPSDTMLASRFRLPAGFRIGIYASELKTPRIMQALPGGHIAVSEMRAGRVTLLLADADMDGRSDGRRVLLEGLQLPHGLAYDGSYLYIAEEHRVSRYAFDAAALTLGEASVIFEGLPTGGNHRSRSIGIGPDGMLYLTVGSSCNVCMESEPYRAVMLRMNTGGSDAQVIAEGLRNSVGFDWHGLTGALFATDNGRDLLGDDLPDDELNIIWPDAHYGWPYAYGEQVADPDFGPGNEKRVAESVASVHGFGAHVAPLGIDFIEGRAAHSGLQGRALVALHGSWNRSTLAGYKLVLLTITPDAVLQQDFLVGFEEQGDVIGRPVDVEEGSDGSIFISDDYAGVVYRIGHGQIPVASAAGPAVPPKPADPLGEMPSSERAKLASVGALLYVTSGCESCHILPGEIEREGAARKPLGGLADRYDLEALSALLAAPPSPMPSYEEFTDIDRRALAVYLLELQGN